jgi:rubrerythrin
MQRITQDKDVRQVTQQNAQESTGHEAMQNKARQQYVQEQVEQEQTTQKKDYEQEEARQKGEEKSSMWDVSLSNKPQRCQGGNWDAGSQEGSYGNDLLILVVPGV